MFFFELRWWMDGPGSLPLWLTASLGYQTRRLSQRQKPDWASRVAFHHASVAAVPSFTDPFSPRLYPHTSPSLLQDYPSIHPSHRPPFSSVRHHRQQVAHTSFRPPSSLRPICMQPCRAPVGVVRAGRPSQGIRAAGKTGAEKRNAENLISLRIIPL